MIAKFGQQDTGAVRKARMEFDDLPHANLVGLKTHNATSVCHGLTIQHKSKHPRGRTAGRNLSQGGQQTAGPFARSLRLGETPRG